MHRRQFLLGTGALMVGLPVRAAPPPIHTIDRLKLDVVIELGVQTINVTGWKVTVNEDIGMDVIAANAGPLGINVCYAKPVRGDWRLIERWYIGPGERNKLVFRRVPDNEDMFFYAELRRSNTEWPFVSGDVPNSNANIASDNTSCHMSWIAPQRIDLQVQPQPRASNRQGIWAERH